MVGTATVCSLCHWSDVFLDALNFPYPQIQGLFTAFIRNSSTFQDNLQNSRTFQRPLSEIQVLFKDF